MEMDHRAGDAANVLSDKKMQLVISKKWQETARAIIAVNILVQTNDNFLRRHFFLEFIVNKTMC